MDTNNPLQQRTGQVAPTAQNPQVGSGQPYQQSTEQLQTTNSQLLENGGGLRIVVPASSGTKSSTSQQQVSAVTPSIVPTVVLSGLCIASLFMAVFLIRWAMRKTKHPVPTIIVDEDTSDPDQPVVEEAEELIVQNSSVQTKQTPKKKPKSKKKKKKRK